VRYLLLANWIPAVVAAVLLLRCGRSLLSPFERVALAGVVLATSLFVPGPGHLILPYYPGVVHALALSIGALWLLRPDGPPSPRRALLAGCLAGLAFCCKQEIGVAALLALATRAFTGEIRPFPWLMRLLAGFAAILLPAAAFVLSSASIESLQRDSHFWPLTFGPSAANRHFYPRIAGIAAPDWTRAVRATVLRDLSLAALLAVGALLFAKERRRAVWLRVLALFAGLGLWRLIEGDRVPPSLPSLALSMSVAFAVAILALLSTKPPGRPFLVAFGTFAGIAGARVAFSPNSAGYYQGPGHFAAALTSVLFALVFLPRLLLGETRAAAYFRNSMALLAFALSWWHTARDVATLRYPDRVAVHTLQGRVFVEPARAALLNAVGRDSSSGERVLVIPEPYAIDALYQLRYASPLVYAIPGWLYPDTERRLIRRFEKAPPDLVVVLERPLKEYGSEPFGVGYGFLLADWISRRYSIVESLPAGEILAKASTNGKK
jgi:hypothetical protein